MLCYYTRKPQIINRNRGKTHTAHSAQKHLMAFEWEEESDNHKPVSWDFLFNQIHMDLR